MILQMCLISRDIFKSLNFSSFVYVLPAYLLVVLPSQQLYLPNTSQEQWSTGLHLNEKIVKCLAVLLFLEINSIVSLSKLHSTRYACQCKWEILSCNKSFVLMSTLICTINSLFLTFVTWRKLGDFLFHDWSINMCIRDVLINSLLTSTALARLLRQFIEGFLFILVKAGRKYRWCNPRTEKLMCHGLFPSIVFLIQSIMLPLACVHLTNLDWSVTFLLIMDICFRITLSSWVVRNSYYHTIRNMCIRLCVSTYMRHAVFNLRLMMIEDYNLNETSYTGETALHVACRTMQSKAILKELVEDSRCDLNAQDPSGNTALHLAVYSGTDVGEKVQCIHVLQSERCNPNITNNEGHTPLHVAVGRKLHDISVILLNHSQCNPNIQDLTGNTPLHMATSEISPSDVKSLLNHKNIDLNIQNREGNTPLHEAVRRQVPINVVEALTLHKSCNPSIANNAGMTPLQISVTSGILDYAETLITSGKCSHEDIVKATGDTLLLHQAVYSNRPKLVATLLNVQEFNINITNSAGETALHVACKMRHCKAVLEELVEDSRCDLNTQNHHGSTALHLAIYSGTDVAEKVQCILQSERCNPNITNSEGYTPLHVAVGRKLYDISMILLNHSQCNPNIQDLTGNTPLHMATSEISPSDVKSLLNHKNIDLNIQNREGNTPLHEAVKRQVSVNVVEALALHKSCNPSIANNAGMTPLQISVTSGILDYAETLITSGKCSHEDIVKATGDTLLLHQAVCPKLVATLLNVQEFNINITNSAGETALHVACRMRHCTAGLEKLVEDSRCDLNTQNHHGNTALHLAIYSGTDVAEKVQCILQSERCNPNITNNEGHTPLHVAVGRKLHGISVILLNHSQCNPNIQDLTGNTPLHMATSEISPSDVKSLLNHKNIDLNIQNREGNTPLHEAVKRQVPIDVVEALTLHKSCNLSVANNAGMTPLQISVTSAMLDYAETLITSGKCSHEDIVKATGDTLLLHQAVYSNRPKLVATLLNVQEFNINITNSAGETALHVACRMRHRETGLEKLVEDSRCDLNTQNHHGNTALHLAIYSGTDVAEKVQCILQSERCNPNITNNEGHTPLHVAVGRKLHDISVILLNHSQCNPNIQDLTSNTPLHMATSEISPSDVKSLLNHKNIDLNIQNREGNTPLHEAVKRQVPVNVVEALTLHKSCNPSIANNAGMTPLQISVTSGILDYAETLITSGKCSHEDIVKATGDTLLLHQAVYSNRPKLVATLLNVQEFNINITNSAGETALHVACKMRHCKAVLEELVEDSRCDLNTQNHHGSTALHLAIYSGTDVAEKVQCILQSERCNPNITNSEGYTPLHVAVGRKLYDISMILLNHSQCNPNIQDLTGNTPLHMATSEISPSDVKSLLNHKNIDLNIQNREGNTPLHEAVKRQVPGNVVEALTLHKSCNPSIANNAGMTPLQISVTSGILDYAETLITSGKCSHEDIVKATGDTLLLHQAVCPKLVATLLNVQEFNINITNSAGETALHVACRMRHCTAGLEKLVEDSRCDLNTQNHHGNTALHLAIYSGTDVAEKVQCILQSERCNPNITNNEGHTPLHVAVGRKLHDISVILLNHSQCNPNIQDLTGNTPLHMATSEISPSDVKSLLNHKNIDLNIQNREGNTPLHEAVKRQVPINVVEALTLHKSCNLSIANNAGMTPLQISVTSAMLDYAETLITSGKCSHEDMVKATGDTLLLHQAVYSNRPKLVAMLLNVQEFNINITNSAGETALHVACRMRHRETGLEKLVEDSRCDLNTQNHHGNTALHLAIYSGTCVAEKVQCILQSERCNPNITNSEGYTPLHVAVGRKLYDISVILLNHSQCNPNIQDLTGNTPLHMVLSAMPLLDIESFLMHKNIVLDIQDRVGNTPLHVALVKQIPVNVVKSLVLHSSCNPSIANTEGMTPLKIAVDSQQMETATILITSKKCSREDIVRASKDASLLLYAVFSDNVELLTALIGAGIDISQSNSKGETALHAACKEGNIEATQLLLQNGADVLAVDCEGNAPVHVACANMTLECLRLILHHKRCNPNQQNAVGDTPLHILCSYGWTCDMRMLHTLLSTPGINPECVNHAGQIPAELAKSNYSVIEIISKYLELNNTELETYVKIFVVGNSGGGKSTLIKAITTKRSRSFTFRAKYVNPSEVPPHTAGIVPLSFNSKHFGHAVLYDFAGQHEYYSSHAAVMENLVLPSPPLFLLLIDISKPMDKVREELVYWWMFINNHSKKATAPPHVILVGSHKDIVKERRGNVRRTMEQITDIVRDIPVSFQFDCHKPFPLDCRKLVSRGLTALLAQLKLTCQTLRQTADIDLHCHILKAFLTTNFHSLIACEVSEIVERMKSEDDLLPQEPSQLIPLLSTLSDKGHILLLQNHTDMSKSWVVLKPKLLLAEVNGSIFAPDNFKEHCSGFSMSTGVVALSNIKKEFVNYNSQVIVGYLTYLEFCFRIKDQHTLEMITKDATLQLTAHDSGYAEEYYFFPSLIQKENPSDVWQPQETIKYECGWFYRCNEPTEQLTTRFLHVLILRLAFSCNPPDEPTERESVVPLRSCSVWKHGIAWWTNDGIKTIVEVGLQCRWVAVMLRCPDTHKVQCAELRTKVISTVLKTKQDFCPAIGMKEFLIAPSSLQYPFEGRELTLYSMREIAKVVIAGIEFPKDTEGKSTIPISQLLPFEPFFNFGEDLIGNLFTPDQSREREISRDNMSQIAKKSYKMLDNFMEALQPNPTAFQGECVKPDCTEVDRCVALFQIIQRRGCKTWRDFEQEFSRFSIFCGRHPMVSLML